jgi:hypothetical protein
MLIAITLLATLSAWLGYNINWMRQRHILLSARHWGIRNLDELGAPAPGMLGAFAEPGYSSIYIPLNESDGCPVYERGGTPSHDQPMLSTDAKQRWNEAKTLFPEATVRWMGNGRSVPLPTPTNQIILAISKSHLKGRQVVRVSTDGNAIPKSIFLTFADNQQSESCSLDYECDEEFIEHWNAASRLFAIEWDMGELPSAEWYNRRSCQNPRPALSAGLFFRGRMRG